MLAHCLQTKFLLDLRMQGSDSSPCDFSRKNSRRKKNKFPNTKLWGGEGRGGEGRGGEGRGENLGHHFHGLKLFRNLNNSQ